jgi:glycosyltransferase involved in cell wall biosynthesis
MSKSCNVVIAPSKKSIEVLKRESSLFRNFRFYYNCAVDQSVLQINENVLNKILSKKHSSFLIGIISRIEIQKRIDIALELVHYLKNKMNDIFFIFIGDGPLFDDMITLSKKLNVSDKVLFFNYVPNAKNYIKYFDLLLFTSEWEGFPLTIWEAMKEGVPIVSSDVGGIKEILEGENCGIVYPFGDIEKCAKIIIDLCNDRGKLKQLGMNGYKAVIEKYNSANFKEFFEKLYIGLMNEK